MRKIVKAACKTYSLSILKNEIKSKGENLNYTNLKTQPYFNSSKISTRQAKLLFKIRSRMLHVKCNFKQMYKCRPLGLLCSSCFMIPEDQEHAVQCEKLPKTFLFPYNSLFSLDEEIMVPSLYSFEEIWRLRQEYLNG